MQDYTAQNYGDGDAPQLADGVDGALLQAVQSFAVAGGQ